MQLSDRLEDPQELRDLLKIVSFANVKRRVGASNNVHVVHDSADDDAIVDSWKSKVVCCGRRP